MLSKNLQPESDEFFFRFLRFAELYVWFLFLLKQTFQELLSFCHSPDMTADALGRLSSSWKDLSLITSNISWELMLTSTCRDKNIRRILKYTGSVLVCYMYPAT